MKLVQCARLFLLHCVFVIAHAAADDTQFGESPPEPAALPGVVDVAPASASWIAGVNRLAEGYERFWLLSAAMRNQTNSRDVREFFILEEIGAGILNFDGPLTVYEMQASHPYLFSYGATWVVEDRSTAAESLGAPCAIGDRQIFLGDIQIPYLGKMPMSFDEELLSIGNGDANVERIIASEPLADLLPDAECAKLRSADAVGLLGRGERLEYFWKRSLPPAPTESAEPLTEEQNVQQQIRKLAEDVEWLTLGITVDFDETEVEKPLGSIYQASVLFDRETASESTELLRELSSEDRAATLAGLPAGDPLLVFAGALAGEDNQTYYRQLAELAGRYWNRRLRLKDSLSARQFYGIFEEVGEHMQGVRLAVYRNPDSNGVGEYSVVFIADADDPDAFIQELQQMMRLARADEVDIDRPEEAVTDEEIAGLVQSLGDRTFRVRRDATNRLLVIGTRARPFLETGLAAESLELRTRARVILEHFETLGSVDAKHFFGSDLLEKLDPDFRYVPAGEVLPDGPPVDWISITLPDESQPYAQQLIAWLGPDWNRWRLVHTEDHIVVCASSRPELLAETLANLQTPELAQLQVAGWSDNGQAHQFELHFDAYEFVPETRWNRSPLLPGDVPGLTSIGLNIAPDALRVYAYSPLMQLRRTGGL